MLYREYVESDTGAQTQRLETNRRKSTGKYSSRSVAAPQLPKYAVDPRK